MDFSSTSKRVDAFCTGTTAAWQVPELQAPSPQHSWPQAPQLLESFAELISQPLLTLLSQSENPLLQAI
jgi:hypothetical protein